MRKMIGMVVVGVMAAAFFAAASPAGAQQTGGSCIFTVAPNPVPTPPGFPATVTVSGTASPVGATITVFVDPPGATDTTQLQLTTTVANDGTFTVPVHLLAQGTLSVGLTFDNGNAYTGTCATPQGLPSVLVLAEGVQAIRPAAAALAFTGSNDTPSYVLVGIAALVLGAVFVVAARRRSQVS